MIIKLTNKKIVEASGALEEIARKELPVKVSYSISKNISQIRKELEVYNNERQKLIEKYCSKAEEENKYKIDDIENWNKDSKELDEIQVDIDINRFKLDDILDFNMSAAELMAIDFMIEQ
ncbi:hypothetical protein ACFO6R_05910 [Eubacterium multiforme]|uniref:Iron-regulated protein n=1 Tax=Eubacterium multiforme TaxID=83339 RepID=A0ABT9US27_9FIRM|nr:hypothetical protein [Eubacterium multiforme]MDQ0149118.1 putative iron-regulated protein [Eubacterium multiforme]